MMGAHFVLQAIGMGNESSCHSSLSGGCVRFLAVIQVMPRNVTVEFRIRGGRDIVTWSSYRKIAA
jgi:hypothetical protein